jgi:hypothetical protein
MSSRSVTDTARRLRRRCLVSARAARRGAAGLLDRFPVGSGEIEQQRLDAAELVSRGVRSLLCQVRRGVRSLLREVRRGLLRTLAGSVRLLRR